MINTFISDRGYPRFPNPCSRPPFRPTHTTLGLPTFHSNLPDSYVGAPWRRCMPYGATPQQGYGIDLNRNGRYDPGQDGVLVFDMNGNGRYDQGDVAQTNAMMKSVSGNMDLNGDGGVGFREFLRAQQLSQRYIGYDTNRDGRLSAAEIARGGGSVWVDHSPDGRMGFGEVYSPYRLPGANCGGPRRLNYVDPFWGSSTSAILPRHKGEGLCS